MRNYQTRQRELLKDYFEAHANTKCSASDVFLALKDEGISRSFVYRNLDRLVSEGFLEIGINEAGTHAMYEYRSCGMQCAHLHMQCVKCGKTFHLKNGRQEFLLKKIFVENGFEVDVQRSILKGYCDGCKED